MLEITVTEHFVTKAYVSGTSVMVYSVSETYVIVRFVTRGSVSEKQATESSATGKYVQILCNGRLCNKRFTTIEICIG